MEASKSPIFILNIKLFYLKSLTTDVLEAYGPPLAMLLDTSQLFRKREGDKKYINICIRRVKNLPINIQHIQEDQRNL